jgi:hypothetical protein
VVLPVYDDEGVCSTVYGPDLGQPAGAEPRTAVERQVEAICGALPGPVLHAWLTGLDLRVLPVAIVVAAAWKRMAAYCHAGALAAAGEWGGRPEMHPHWSTLAGPPVVAGVAGDELAMRLRDSRPPGPHPRVPPPTRRPTRHTPGRTSAANLGHLCRRHHRLKTDGGFRLRQIAPGLLEWITPTGHRYLVRPGTGQSLDITAQPHGTATPFSPVRGHGIAVPRAPRSCQWSVVRCSP